MKTLKFLSLILLSFSLGMAYAKEINTKNLQSSQSGVKVMTTPKAATTDSTNTVNPGAVIVDTRPSSDVKVMPQVTVESGSDVVIGEPQENFKAAVRSWNQACESWKQQLKMDNGKNLLIRSCGVPKQRVEKVDLKTYYVLESKSTYKIKVGCP